MDHVQHRDIHRTLLNIFAVKSKCFRYIEMFVLNFNHWNIHSIIFRKTSSLCRFIHCSYNSLKLWFDHRKSLIMVFKHSKIDWISILLKYAFDRRWWKFCYEALHFHDNIHRIRAINPTSNFAVSKLFDRTCKLKLNSEQIGWSGLYFFFCLFRTHSTKWNNNFA